MPASLHARTSLPTKTGHEKSLQNRKVHCSGAHREKDQSRRLRTIFREKSDLQTSYRLQNQVGRPKDPVLQRSERNHQSANHQNRLQDPNDQRLQNRDQMPKSSLLVLRRAEMCPGTSLQPMRASLQPMPANVLRANVLRTNVLRTVRLQPMRPGNEETRPIHERRREAIRGHRRKMGPKNGLPKVQGIRRFL